MSFLWRWLLSFLQNPCSNTKRAPRIFAIDAPSRSTKSTPAPHESSHGVGGDNQFSPSLSYLGVAFLVLFSCTSTTYIYIVFCTCYYRCPPHTHAFCGLSLKQIDITNIENSFMFNTGFQSSAALAKNMEYCVGSLSANRDFLEELRAELDGQVRI